MNFPLLSTAQHTIEVEVESSVMASMFVLIIFCFVPGSFVVFQVKEKVCKAKHVQIASGLHPSAYWTSTFLWDLTVFFALTATDADPIVLQSGRQRLGRRS